MSTRAGAVRAAEGGIGAEGTVADWQGAGGAAPASPRETSDKARAAAEATMERERLVAAVLTGRGWTWEQVQAEAAARNGRGALGAPPRAEGAGAEGPGLSAFRIKSRVPNGAEGPANSNSTEETDPYAPPRGRDEFKSAANPLGLSSIHACINGTRYLHVWQKGVGGIEGRNAAIRAEAASKGKGGSYMVLPYTCNSLRHSGPCRKAKHAENYDRIKRTLAPIPIAELSLMVLTFDQRAFRREGESDASARFRAFKACYPQWSKLLKRLIREYGPTKFIATGEEMRSGWLHMNIIVWNRELGEKVSDGEDGYKVPRRKIMAMAVECGFGRVFHLSPAKSKEALGNYIAKLASDIEAPAYKDPATGKLVAEVTKTTQAPIHAPRHFRALRASHRFLKPKKKNPAYTGMMMDKDEVRAGSGYQARRSRLDFAIALVDTMRSANAPVAKLVWAERNLAVVLDALEADVAEAILRAEQRAAEKGKAASG